MRQQPALEQHLLLVAAAEIADRLVARRASGSVSRAIAASASVALRRAASMRPSSGLQPVEDGERQVLADALAQQQALASCAPAARRRDRRAMALRGVRRSRRLPLEQRSCRPSERCAPNSASSRWPWPCPTRPPRPRISPLRARGLTPSRTGLRQRSALRAMPSPARLLRREGFGGDRAPVISRTASPSVKFAGVGHRHQLAVAQHGDAVAETHDLVPAVRDEEHDRAIAPQPVDQSRAAIRPRRHRAPTSLRRAAGRAAGARPRGRSRASAAGRAAGRRRACAARCRARGAARISERHARMRARDRCCPMAVAARSVRKRFCSTVRSRSSVSSWKTLTMPSAMRLMRSRAARAAGRRG